MRRLAAFCLGCLWLFAGGNPSAAQDRPSWFDEVFGDRWEYVPRHRQRAPISRPTVQEIVPPVRRDQGAREETRDGGAKPAITPSLPARIAFRHNFPANSIVIDTSARKLYFVLPDKHAYEYPISVGREGFNWTGTEKITRKLAWPDWYPPQEMRERDPDLPVKMTGGIKNPLGAMALYLGETLYRIHGTNDVKSIGQAQSSGCFRMLNSAVLHLASVAEIGTPVTVVKSLNSDALISRAPVQPARPPLQRQTPSSIGAGHASQAYGPLDYHSLRRYALEPRH
jgi:lipoprotein-anchoring transpeptidase ErfK/SrfK